MFDLTQMFGTAVADYVYGQGAAFFRKWFGKQWYPYNAGELLSVEGLQSHDMVGFNQWDEEWEVGTYLNTNGQKYPSSAKIRNKNPIPVLPNTAYVWSVGTTSTDEDRVWCYDHEMNHIRSFAISHQTSLMLSFTTPSNCYYVNFAIKNTTYNHDICISLAHNNSRNGEYEPYEKHSYPLDSTVILRGIPKVGANGVYWDGDRYLPDGTVERRYGVVDLGSLDWSGTGADYFTTNVNINVPSATQWVVQNGMCSIYTIQPMFYIINQAAKIDNSIAWYTNYIRVADSSYADSAAFKSAMQGVLLVYELATPTTETAQPYHSTQWVSDWGTEEFVSTGIVPVGTETRYPANLRDKLQHLPDAASGNGSYLITQTDGQMVLTPFPAPPSTAGNYVLKATVTNGVATYTWEVAT